MAGPLDGPSGVAPEGRLGLPSAAAWVTAWQGRLLPPYLLAGCALVLLVITARVLLRSRAGWAAVLAATLVCAAAAGLATAARGHAHTHGPLAQAATAQASVRVEGVLPEDPRIVPPKGDVLSFQQLVVARLRVERLEVAGRVFHQRQPVLVLTSDAHWLGLLPSQRVRVEGRLQAPGHGRDIAALLSSRGAPVVLAGPSSLQAAAGVLRRGLQQATAPCRRASAVCCPDSSKETGAASTSGCRTTSARRDLPT